jgi:hypothetical protein
MEMLMKDPFDSVSESVKYVIDALSFATVLGTLINMLPSVAALFTILWTAIRIYETKTVQKLLRKKDAEQ